jgi:hypothetical protein
LLQDYEDEYIDLDSDFEDAKVAKKGKGRQAGRKRQHESSDDDDDVSGEALTDNYNKS